METRIDRLTPEDLAHLIGDCTWGEAKLMLAAPDLLTALERIESAALEISPPSPAAMLSHVAITARAAIEAATKRASPDHNSTPNGCEDGCPACEVEK